MGHEYTLMPKRKTQKVRFQKGDKRPGSMTGTLSYVKKMKKKKKDIIWQNLLHLKTQIHLMKVRQF